MSKAGPSMQVAVNVKDPVLMELLFAREYWPATAVGEPGGTLTIPVQEPSPVVPPFTPSEWQQTWQQRIETIRNDTAAAPRASMGDPAAFTQWLASQPVTLADAVGDAWPADLYAAWLAALVARDRERIIGGVPEQRHADALEDAWKAGLRDVTVLPLDSYSWQWLNGSHLLVTDGVRDSDRYREALRGASSQQHEAE